MNKKLLFICIGTLLTLSVSAQFTITKSNMPTKFNVEYRINDTIPDVSITSGNSGAGQTWDFTAMNIHTLDTNAYVDPAGTPAATTFPEADVVLINQSTANKAPKAHVYIKITDMYAGILGTYQENPGQPGMMITPVFKPINKYWLFPATYLTAFKDTLNFVLNYKQQGSTSVDSVRVKYESYTDNIIDAYGTVLTPTAGFTNVMRLKQYTLHTDSVEVHVRTGQTSYEWQLYEANADTITTYSWYSDLYKFPVAQLTYKGSNMKLENASYLTHLDKASSLREESENKGIFMFPNPCNEELAISISNNAAAVLCIFDITGKKKEALDLRFNKQVKVNTSTYGEGLYIYTISDNTGTTIGTGKFNVIK